MSTVPLIVLRGLRKHRVRVAMGFIAVFFAALLLHMYVAMTDALQDFMGGTIAQSTLIVKPRGAMYQTQLPNRYVDEVRKLPGVVAATPIPNTALHGERGDSYFMGVDPEDFRTIAGTDLDSIPAEVYAEFVRDPNAAIVSRGVAIEHKFRVGQTVSLPMRPLIDTALYPDFQPPPNPVFNGKIIGEISQGILSDRVILIHRKTMERAYNWDRTWALLVRFDKNTSTETLAAQIEKQFTDRERGVEVLVLDNWLAAAKTFISQLSAIILSVVGLAGLVAAILLVHGVAAGAVEMMRELAILRALGTSRLGVLLVLAGEGIVVTLAGALTATLFLWVTTHYSSLIDFGKLDQNVMPIFAVRFKGLVTVLGAGLAVAGLGAVLPSAILNRAPISALMRRRG